MRMPFHDKILAYLERTMPRKRFLAEVAVNRSAYLRTLGEQGLKEVIESDPLNEVSVKKTDFSPTTIITFTATPSALKRVEQRCDEPTRGQAQVQLVNPLDDALKAWWFSRNAPVSLVSGKVLDVLKTAAPTAKFAAVAQIPSGFYKDRKNLKEWGGLEELGKAIGAVDDSGASCRSSAYGNTVCVNFTATPSVISDIATGLFMSSHGQSRVRLSDPLTNLVSSFPRAVQHKNAPLRNNPV